MRTPAEHYERAEELLDEAYRASDPLTAARLVTRAQAHATLAAVPWAGTDDDEPPTVNEDLVVVLTELAGWARSATVIPNVDTHDAEAYVNGVEAAKGIVAGLVDPVLATLEAPHQ